MPNWPRRHRLRPNHRLRTRQREARLLKAEVRKRRGESRSRANKERWGSYAKTDLAVDAHRFAKLADAKRVRHEKLTNCQPKPNKRWVWTNCTSAGWSITTSQVRWSRPATVWAGSRDLQKNGIPACR